MQYAEAFRKLGYALTSVRGDWSAANDQGVAITLWSKELSIADKRPFIDTRIDCGPPEHWSSKPGNMKRIAHLQRAVAEHDGLVDVIIVHGTPGIAYGDADPWMIGSRKSRWRVRRFDQVTGHFTAGVEAAN